VFALAGLAGIVVGRGLTVGSIARMGPGFFPLLVSGGLVAIGAGLILRGVRRRSVRQPFGWETTAWLMAALVAFALLIEDAGLIAAVAAASLLASAALRRAEARAGVARPRRATVVEGLALAAVLSAGSALVFALGLGLPLRLWP
jgi:hypothetical protein